MVEKKKVTLETDQGEVTVTIKVTPPTPEMIKRHHEKKVRSSLRASTAEGMFNASSSSITTTFITPLALALGASNGQIGIMTTVQNFANTMGQIPGAKLTQYVSRKKIWMVSQLTSKIFFIVPIMFLPFLFGGHDITLLIVLMALIAFFAGLRNPAWTSMMGDLVTEKIRGKYFGMRNMVTGIAGITTTLVSGYLVATYGFSFVFFLSIILSVISIAFFMRMYEPPVKKVFHYGHRFAIHPRDWKNAIMLNKPLVIFTVYLCLMYFATEIASPYYAVYMLKNMDISYFWFGVLTVIGAIVRIISFKHWGRINDRFGSRKTLLVTGFFGCFTPFLFLFVGGVLDIALVKIFDGFIWAGFDLVIFNYLLDITPANRRPQYIANHNFFVGLGMTMGGLTGAVLVGYLMTASFGLWQGLQLIFLLSFVIRLGILSILPKLREADTKHSRLVPVRYVFWKAVAVDPAHGIKQALSYTFMYPEEIKNELEGSVRKFRYKMKSKGVFG